MQLTGTIINVVLILMGGLIGIFLGNRFSESLRHSVMMALGLFTAAYGIRLFLQTGNALVVLIALLIGLLLGEWGQLEDRLAGLGVWFEKKFNQRGKSDSATFVRGFLAASLLFTIGPMAILGSLQDGLSGDFSVLTIKSVMDGFAAIAFASSLGIGVLFSSLVILVYQGGLSLLAYQLQFLTTDVLLNEISAVGGVMLLGLAISGLLEIKKIKVGNFLPAFLIIPLVVWLFQYFGIY